MTSNSRQCHSIFSELLSLPSKQTSDKEPLYSLKRFQNLQNSGRDCTLVFSQWARISTTSHPWTQFQESNLGACLAAYR